MAELKTFLFTDICRSVDLKNEMVGRDAAERDQAFIRSILTPHRKRIEGQLERHQGRVVSTAGDGHFLVFSNTILAAQWAIDVQKAHRDDPIVTPGEGHVEVRISMHVGVPQLDPADPSNFVGKTVDYASRLNDYASGGQILVSRSAMAILDDVGLEGISMHLHGRRQLKGIGHVEVHELVYDMAGPREMRRRPASRHSDRQWTVVPATVLHETGSSGDSIAKSLSLKRVGNYQLEELLGSGGMGDVYKARHLQFSRIRAVKVIKQQYVDANHQEIIRRFYREIQAIGALEHKNIVVAIDSSSPEDLIHYLVMEYIDGVGLHDLVEQHGPLVPADACEIIRQAARGLQYIHKNNMVHRDVKPSNLMLTLVDSEDHGEESQVSDSSVVEEPAVQRGVVKILDLGLALLVADRDERLTRMDDRAMGTGMYMSPEQWKTTSVDIRADIYSLGCTLYHLLSGHPPFHDSDLRPEKAHEKSKVPPICDGTSIPRKLWDVIRKMLAKNAGDRYETPADVALALAPLVQGHDLIRLVRGYCEADQDWPDPRTTRPESATHLETPSRMSSVLSSVLSARPSRRGLLWSALALGIGGLMVAGSFWRIGPSHEESLVRDEVATLPGLHGEWWFHEIPWFTPAVRREWIDSIDQGQRRFGSGPEGSTSLDEISRLRRSDQTQLLYEDLERVAQGLRNRMASEQKHVSTLLERAMPSLGNPDAASYEKGLIRVLEQLSGMEKNSTNLHLVAVLHHALAQWKEAEEAYMKALTAYQETPSNPLIPLVVLDYARMQLDSKKYDQAIFRFGEVRSHCSNPMLALLTRCMEAEADYRSSSDAILTKPLQLMTDASEEKTLGQNHPLRAYLYERRGWILNEAWRFTEAIKSFEESMRIIKYQMDQPDGSNQYVPMLQLWARQGKATAINFRDGPEAAQSEYQRLVDEIESTLNFSDTPKQFSNLTRQQRQKFRERLPSIYLRLGDCYLIGKNRKYAEASLFYKQCIDECTDLNWEEADRRARWVIDWRYKQCLPAALSGQLDEAEGLYKTAVKQEEKFLDKFKEGEMRESQKSSFAFTKNMADSLIKMKSADSEVQNEGCKSLWGEVGKLKTSDLGRHKLGAYVLAVQQLAPKWSKQPALLRELAVHFHDRFVIDSKTEEQLELIIYLRPTLVILQNSLRDADPERKYPGIQKQLKNIGRMIDRQDQNSPGADHADSPSE